MLLSPPPSGDPVRAGDLPGGGEVRRPLMALESFHGVTRVGRSGPGRERTCVKAVKPCAITTIGGTYSLCGWKKDNRWEHISYRGIKGWVPLACVIW
jgi:hypothetical protein